MTFFQRKTIEAFLTCYLLDLKRDDSKTSLRGEGSPELIKWSEKKMEKKLFDSEYSTQWRKEVDFLKTRGIFPAFMKTNDQQIETFKYTKTPELFAALVEYYAMVKYERQFRRQKTFEVTTDKKEIPGQLTFLEKDDTE